MHVSRCQLLRAYIYLFIHALVYIAGEKKHGRSVLTAHQRACLLGVPKQCTTSVSANIGGTSVRAFSAHMVSESSVVVAWYSDKDGRRTRGYARDLYFLRVRQCPFPNCDEHFLARVKWLGACVNGQGYELQHEDWANKAMWFVRVKDIMPLVVAMLPYAIPTDLSRGALQREMRRRVTYGPFTAFIIGHRNWKGTDVEA